MWCSWFPACRLFKSIRSEMFADLFLLKYKSILSWYWLSWPGTWYSLTSQQDEKRSGGDSRSVGSDRQIGTSADHARISRAVPGRGLTISTLPDNMTRKAVSGRPQAPFPHDTFYTSLFWLDLQTCHFARGWGMTTSDFPCLRLWRRTLKSTTHGAASVPQTHARRSCGWTWPIYDTLTSEYTASCPTHTSRPQ